MNKISQRHVRLSQFFQIHCLATLDLVAGVMQPFNFTTKPVSKLLHIIWGRNVIITNGRVTQSCRPTTCC